MLYSAPCSIPVRSGKAQAQWTRGGGSRAYQRHWNWLRRLGDGGLLRRVRPQRHVHGHGCPANRTAGERRRAVLRAGHHGAGGQGAAGKPLGLHHRHQEGGRSGPGDFHRGRDSRAHRRVSRSVLCGAGRTRDRSTHDRVQSHRHQIHGPGGHRRAAPRRDPEPSGRTLPVRYRVQPGISPRGLGHRGLPASEPDRDRRG